MSIEFDPQGASKIQAIIDFLEAHGASLENIRWAKTEANRNQLRIEKIILPRPFVFDIPIELGDVKEITFKFEKEK